MSIFCAASPSQCTARSCEAKAAEAWRLLEVTSASSVPTSSTLSTYSAWAGPPCTEGGGRKSTALGQ
eukprot:9391799-Pyramimonas_sp.AAC.1